MLFDGPPSELPIATLRPTVRGRRHRFLVELSHGRARCTAWLRPRAVPLIVAFASLFVMAIWVGGEPLALSMQAREVDEPTPYKHGWCTDHSAHLSRLDPTIRIVIRPLTPNDRYTELTIGTLDPR